MATWILVPCLVSLRQEFNTLAPTRDKSSDGSIGDEAHASSSSDHNPDETGATPYEDSDRLNEVHAIDVDIDLRKAGWTMAKAVEVIVTRHRTGADDRLQNVIYNRRIWSRSWGWTAREYTGSNPHDKHAHFSARYLTAAETNTRPWGLLEEDDMPLTTTDAALVTRNLLGTKIGDSGPTVAVALQSGYGNTVKLLAAVTAEVQRDATQNAILAGMQTALSAIASSNGALTDAQVAAITAQVGQAAAAAGAEAVSALKEGLDSLRAHLGDHEPA